MPPKLLIEMHRPVQNTEKKKKKPRTFVPTALHDLKQNNTALTG